MNPIDLSPKQLRKAANIQERLQSLQRELSTLLGATDHTPAEAPKKRKKRRMSAAAKARIAAAARARWAKFRAAKGVTKAVKKAVRKMSAAAKARLSAMAKARWAKAKKAGKTRL